MKITCWLVHNQTLFLVESSPVVQRSSEKNAVAVAIEEIANDAEEIDSKGFKVILCSLQQVMDLNCHKINHL